MEGFDRDLDQLAPRRPTDEQIKLRLWVRQPMAIILCIIARNEYINKYWISRYSRENGNHIPDITIYECIKELIRLELLNVTEFNTQSMNKLPEDIQEQMRQNHRKWLLEGNIPEQFWNSKQFNNCRYFNTSERAKQFIERAWKSATRHHIQERRDPDAWMDNL